MVLDGAGWHRAQESAVPENIRLLPLPPYSPQPNPMEHIWEELREKWFPNLVFQTLQAVEDRLVVAARALERDSARTAAITGVDWNISIPLNAT